jgi:hypothetical protein
MLARHFGIPIQPPVDLWANGTAPYPPITAPGCDPHLLPGAAPLAGFVSAVQTLGHQPLQTRGAHGRDHSGETGVQLRQWRIGSRSVPQLRREMPSRHATSVLLAACSSQMLCRPAARARSPSWLLERLAVFFISSLAHLTGYGEDGGDGRDHFDS